MSQVNFCVGLRVLLYFLYLIASRYRAIIGNFGLLDLRCRYCFKYVFLYF